MTSLDSALRSSVKVKFGEQTVIRNWIFADLTKSGDNFGSNVRLIEVTMNKENVTNKDVNDNDDTKWNCVVKTSAQTESDFFKIFTGFVFKNEMEFLTEWVPKINNHLGNFGLQHLITPECYGYSLEKGKEFILMEDMRLLKYNMAPKPNRQMSLEECKTVIIELARLHAVSHIILKKQIQTKKIDHYLMKKGPVQNIFLGLLDKRIQSALSFLKEENSEQLQIEKTDETKKEKDCTVTLGENNETVAGMEKLKTKAISFLQSVQKDKLLFLEEIMGSVDMRFLSLCHGDTWTNNYLFSADGSSCSLLDFQLVSIASLANDINYLLYTSLESLYQGHGDIQTLLGEYYTSYRHTANAMNHKVEFTAEELEVEVQRTMRWGVVGGVVVLPMMRDKWTKKGQGAYRDRFLKLFSEIEEIDA